MMRIFNSDIICWLRGKTVFTNTFIKNRAWRWEDLALGIPRWNLRIKLRHTICRARALWGHIGCDTLNIHQYFINVFWKFVTSIGSEHIKVNTLRKISWCGLGGPILVVGNTGCNCLVGPNLDANARSFPWAGVVAERAPSLRSLLESSEESSAVGNSLPRPNLAWNARSFPWPHVGAERAPSSQSLLKSSEESSDEDDSSLDDEAAVPSAFLPSSFGIGCPEESAIEVLEFKAVDECSFFQDHWPAAGLRPSMVIVGDANSISAT